MTGIIEVYQIEIDDIIRWKFRVTHDVGTVGGHSDYATRDDAINAARQNPANTNLPIRDIGTPGRP